MCAADSSDYNNLEFITERKDVCGEPTSLMVDQVTDTSALLSWSAVANTDYYSIRRSLS